MSLEKLSKDHPNVTVLIAFVVYFAIFVILSSLGNMCYALYKGLPFLVAIGNGALFGVTVACLLLFVVFVIYLTVIEHKANEKVKKLRFNRKVEERVQEELRKRKF